MIVLALLLVSPALFSAQSVGTDGSIYAQYNDVLYAVNGDAAGNGAGKLRWSFSMKNMGSYAHGVQDVMYVSAQPVLGGPASLFGISSKNGTLLWNVTAPCTDNPQCLRTISSGMLALPVAHDGTVYFRTLGRNYPVYNTSGNTPGTLQAVGPDGVVKWNISVGRDDDPMTIGQDGSILVHGREDGSLYYLHPDGTIKGRLPAKANAGGRSIARDGTVYIIPDANYPFSDDTYLLALDGATLRVRFNISLTINSDRGEATQKPVLGDNGLIYVDGLRGDKVGTCILRAFHSNGTEAWVKPSSCMGPSLVAQKSFDGQHDVLYVLTEGRTGSAVIALSGENGAVLWKATNITANGGGLAKSASIGEDGTICVWDDDDSSLSEVYAIRDHAKVWALQTGGTENPVITQKGTVYVQGWGARPSSTGVEFYLKLFSVSRDGRVQWMFAPPSKSDSSMPLVV